MRRIKSFFTISVLLFLTLFFSKSFAQYTWVDTTDSAGNVIRMKVNDKTGAPHRLYGLKVNFNNRYGHITEQNAQGLSRQFLTEHAKLLKIQPAALKFESAVNNKGKWYINFQQQYRGVPVYRANVGFTIHENGNVVLVGTDAYPDISIDVTPAISSDEALKIAQSNFVELTGTDSLVIRKEPKLIILPTENEKDFSYLLSWNIQLEYIDSLSVFSEAYFIDAKKGNIVRQYSNIRDASIWGTVNIEYWPEHYYDPDSTDYYKKGRIELYVTVPPEEPAVRIEYTNSNGFYIFSNLSSNPYNIYARLVGSYVRLYNNSDLHFDTIGSGAHNWTWDASDATNVYYHADWIHDFFKGASFYYNGMDYQMRAYVNQGPYYNGWADGTNIGFGSQDGEYWARSSDVVYHEYTHNTIYHLYGNGWIGYVEEEEGRAMDEGFADYFACTINDDHIQGESVNVSRDLDNNRTMADYHDYYHIGVEYWNSLIISGACWDLREDSEIEVNYANELVFDALQMTPHAYDFEDFAFNIAVADDDDGNLNNSVPHYVNIIQAFETNHGIPVSSIPPPPPQNLEITNAGQNGQSPNLSWNASSGADSYRIYRSTDTHNWQVLTTVTNTSYTDNDVTIETNSRLADDKYYYKVTAIRGIAESEPSNIVSTWGILDKRGNEQDIITQDSELPETFSLQQNYPNPFNPMTTIRFSLPEQTNVEIKIFNTVGHEIATLVKEQKSAGIYSVEWNGKNELGKSMPSGLYLYRIKAGNFVKTHKMMLLK